MKSPKGSQGNLTRLRVIHTIDMSVILSRIDRLAKVSRTLPRACLSRQNKVLLAPEEDIQKKWLTFLLTVIVTSRYSSTNRSWKPELFSSFSSMRCPCCGFALSVFRPGRCTRSDLWEDQSSPSVSRYRHRDHQIQHTIGRHGQSRFGIRRHVYGNSS